MVIDGDASDVDADVVVEWPLYHFISASVLHHRGIKVYYQSHHIDLSPSEVKPEDAYPPPCHSPPQPPLICN